MDSGCVPHIPSKPRSCHLTSHNSGFTQALNLVVVSIAAEARILVRPLVTQPASGACASVTCLCTRCAGGVFDPFGFSKGDEELLRKYKENEIKNGRLAMVRCWRHTATHMK